jgi:glycerol-3-phosphate cytidylyltransferase-like family protein
MTISKTRTSQSQKITVAVLGAFDNLLSQQVRFLQESASFGDLHVFLWSDEIISTLIESVPKYSQEERQYLLQAIRFVTEVHVIKKLPKSGELPLIKEYKPDIWAIETNPFTRER